uniref:Uncharacterized protein n=1 Tax=Tanacetum cinerariifolium TaxID=118510 RepID=A0A699I8Z5_TANCI|nr:hypothetical protein [Tanacetum cinerariifolium]
MDLFVFIRHSDPTKVLIGEREPVEREVKLLTLTKGRIVQLNPPVSAASGDSGDSIDKLFDEGNDDVPEETVAKDVSKVAAEKTKKKRKRKVAEDASGFIFLPKRLKEDHPTAASNTRRKSLATIRDLVPDGTSVLSGFTGPPTFVSVPPTPYDGPLNENSSTAFGVIEVTVPFEYRSSFRIIFPRAASETGMSKSRGICSFSSVFRTADVGWLRGVCSASKEEISCINDRKPVSLIVGTDPAIGLRRERSLVLGFPIISLVTVSCQSETLVRQGSACNCGCERRLPSASVLRKCLICVRLETYGPQPTYLWA